MPCRSKIGLRPAVELELGGGVRDEGPRELGHALLLQRRIDEHAAHATRKLVAAACEA